ncbi:MAG TPA: YqjK-like family protein [Thiobacillus sp.]
MNSKLTQLAERRQQLVGTAAAQRATLTDTLEPWRTRLAQVDRGMAVLRYVRSHPVLWVGASLLLTVLRPRRVGRWLQHGLMAWQIGRRLRRH